MRIYYDDSPTGSGKTRRQIDYITSKDCRVLFIVERIDRFEELRREIDMRAAINGTKPWIRTISSQSGNRSNSVARKIEALPSDYPDHRHVIVLATHAAMLSSDFSDFAGWEIIIDEVPSFLDFEQKTTHLDQAFFDQYYSLTPLLDGWSIVEATEAGEELTPASVRADDSHIRAVHVFEPNPEMRGDRRTPQDSSRSSGIQAGSRLLHRPRPALQ